MFQPSQKKVWTATFIRTAVMLLSTIFHHSEQEPPNRGWNMRATNEHPVDDGDVECAVVAAVSAASTVRVSNKLAFPATEVRTKIEKKGGDGVDPPLYQHDLAFVGPVGSRVSLSFQCVSLAM